MSGYVRECDRDADELAKARAVADAIIRADGAGDLEQYTNLEDELAQTREQLSKEHDAYEAAAADAYRLKADLAEARNTLGTLAEKYNDLIDRNVKAETRVEASQALGRRFARLAQSWRDEAFGSQHMSKLKSDTLERCAAEIDAIAEGR